MKHITTYGVEYSVEDCGYLDINDHYSLVEELVNDVPKDVYLYRMHTCIDQKFAKKCYKDNVLVAFMYNFINDDGIAEGVSFYSVDPIGCTTLLYEMFNEHSKVVALYVLPHKDNISVYKMFATRQSLDGYRTHGTPLRVKIKEVTRTLYNLYSKVMLDG